MLSSVTVNATGKILTRTPLKTVRANATTGAWSLTAADGVDVKADLILCAESPADGGWPGMPSLAPVPVSISAKPIAPAVPAASPAATPR